MKKESLYNRILLALLAALLLIGGMGVALFPAPDFSEQENRMLADFPTASPEGLASGGYTAAIDTYLSERFPWRGELRRLHATTELALGRMQTSDIIPCMNGTLLALPSANARTYRKNLAALARLLREAEIEGKPCHVTAVPHRTLALRALLPRFYSCEALIGDAERLKEETGSREILRHLTREEDWYRTDHHLTTEGAYRAYVALADTLGFSPHRESDFQIDTVSHSFLGTLDARAGIPHIAPDDITLPRFAGDTEYLVKRDGKPAVLDGFYDKEKLQTRDGYAVFFGGNCGVLEIGLGERDSRPTLLVIRDSYASAILPFLARHFHIIAVDPRYADKQAILAELQKSDATLLLFGMQTITETPFLV